MSLMRERKLVFAVLAAVFVAHLASYGYLASLSASNPDSAPYPVVRGDSEQYIRLAEALRQGAYAFDGVPERHWPPGYPAFLAASREASDFLRDKSWTLAIALQVALALLAVALIFRMAARFVPPPLAAAAALLFGLDPNVILSNTTIISDGLFSSLLIITVYLAFFADSYIYSKVLKNLGIREGERHAPPLRWGVVGLLLGILTLIRPIAQFLIPLALLYLVVILVRARANWRAHVLPIALFAAAAAALVAPWSISMHQKFGTYEIAHVGASNLLHYNAADFLIWKKMYEGGRSVPAFLVSRYRNDPVRLEVQEQLSRELQSMTPPGEDSANYEGALAAKVILADPARYTYFHLINTAPFFIGSSFAAYGQAGRQIGAGDSYFAPTSLALRDALAKIRVGDGGAVSRAALALAPVAAEILFWTLALALAAFAVSLHRRDGRALVLAALVLYFALLTGPLSIVRYRIPAEAFLLILAAVGAYAVAQKWRNRTMRA